MEDAAGQRQLQDALRRAGVEAVVEPDAAVARADQPGVRSAVLVQIVPGDGLHRPQVVELPTGERLIVVDGHLA